MKINVLAVFPQILDSLNYGVTGTAIEKNILEIHRIDLKDYPLNSYGSIDDKPFSGSEGMVISPIPISKAMNLVKNKGKVIYLSPQGKTLNQKKVKELATLNDLTIICGRYEGIDQRIVDEYVDEEISIGDYVLSGGEIAATVLIDSIVRNLPGALGNEKSLTNDSFSDGRLKGDSYTRPRDFEGRKVPDELVSGNHELVKEWKIANSLWVTKQKRPDLFSNLQLSEKEMILLQKYELAQKNLRKGDG